VIHGSGSRVPARPERTWFEPPAGKVWVEGEFRHHRVEPRGLEPLTPHTASLELSHPFKIAPNRKSRKSRGS
jgi:hypothetical protein